MRKLAISEVRKEDISMAKQKADIGTFLPPLRPQALISADVDKELHEVTRQLMKENRHQWTEVLEAALKAYVLNYGGDLPSHLKR